MTPEAFLDMVIGILPAFATFYMVALGHSIFEKAGILNLAIDGVFFAATGAAVVGAVGLGNPVYGSILAAVVAAILGLFMSFVLTYLPISHGAVGLSLQFLGYGLGIVFGYSVRLAVGAIYSYAYSRDAVYEITLVALAIGVLVHLLVEKTKLGSAIRACGENPHAAAALGVNVIATRLIAGALGFALIGLGSSLFVLLWVRIWDIKTYTLGYGWLAFAVALAAGRHPLFLIPIALLFGGLVDLQTTIQARLKVPADVAKLVPFVGALVLMLAYSITRLRRVFAQPTSLGKPYYKEEKSI